MDIESSVPSLEPEFLDAFKADLSAALKLDQLPEEERNARLTKIGDLIFQMILFRVFNELDETGQKELAAFRSDPAKASDPAAFYNFLRAKLPNLREIIAEEVEAFQRDALEGLPA